MTDVNKGALLLRQITRMEREIRELRKLAEEVVGTNVVDEVLRLHHEGLTVRQISEKVSRSYNAVYTRIKREGLTPVVGVNHSAWTKSEDDFLLSLVKEKGTAWKLIAAQLNRNPGGVQSRYYLIRPR